MEKFHYLKVGLSLALVFVGERMLVAGVYKIPILASLGVIGALLAGSIVASLLRRPPDPRLPLNPPSGGPTDWPAEVKP